MKEKMITRTITTTKATALCMDISDINNPKTENHIFTVPGYNDSNMETLKACKEFFENDTLKIVAILTSEKVETLYGMPESKFIENAVILPPRFSSKEEQ